MFVENMAAFFGPDDVGVVAATIGAATVYGSLEDPYAEPFPRIAEGNAPSFMCATADVATVAQGDAVTIGAKSFIVRGVQPDGTGMTTLILEQA
jgi:Phage Head-Tail Attachment